MISQDQFLTCVLQNPANARLLDILPALGLPQGMLTAGCLFQAVWNVRGGKPADWGVRDYDVFYFDDTDLSWRAEDAVIQRAARLLGDAGAGVQIRNQARVHLWYAERFGRPYARLTCVEDGIDRFLVACTRVGLTIAERALYAPDGLGDLWNGILRINPDWPAPDLFARKCADYRARWPWLTIGG